MANPNTTIQFDNDVDQIRRARSRDAATATGADLDDGIVFSRTITARRRSLSLPPLIRWKTLDAEDPKESGLVRPGDHKQKQVFKGTQLLLLAYQSIGVIYGDIGTSPLYVLSSTFGSNAPARHDLIGVLSLVLWALTLMVTLKYVLIILRADNQGEGGTFSCYSLLSRYANITKRDPREEPLIQFQRWQTNEMHKSNKKVRNVLEHSKILKGLLRIIGVLAVTMVLSDGVLTPAQSVLGAVEGLNVVAPNISYNTVVGTTCGILVLLFVIQPFGVSKIGTTFAPIIIIWLGLIAAFGVYNMIKFDAGVWMAWNPAEAIGYLQRHGTDGWRSLGGVLLAFTGVEALFADLGAFSMRAIQISWLGWTYPCLILAYLGQAAYISVHPEAYAYPVFSTAPPGCLILSIVFAVLAAIVASQAIITATFQLLAQIIKLSYFPAIEVRHTSRTHHNQLYVPLANYLLCIGTVIIAAVYKNTTALGNAYGACVMFVTFFDTCMTTLVALVVWRIRPWIVFLPWLAIASMDGAFLSSALTKVPQGAWFTISLASILASILVLWRFGKEQQWAAEKEDRKPIPHLVRPDSENVFRLVGTSEQKGGEPIAFNQGFGIFFDKGGINTPTAFSQFLSKLVSTPAVVIFYHMRPLEYPTVPADERFVVSQVKTFPNCYRVVCRHGYMDEVVTADLASTIYRHVRKYVMDKNRTVAERDLTSPDLAHVVEKSPTAIQDDNSEERRTPEESIAASEPGQLTLSHLQSAYEHRVLYVVGKEELHVRPGTSFIRRLLLETFIFMRDNTRNKMANLNMPMDRLVEIGFVKDV